MAKKKVRNLIIELFVCTKISFFRKPMQKKIRVRKARMVNLKKFKN